MADQGAVIAGLDRAIQGLRSAVVALDEVAGENAELKLFAAETADVLTRVKAEREERDAARAGG